MAIKNNLREILKQQGLKQNWLAEQVGIDKRTLSNIVANKYNTSLEVAFKIAKILDMRPDEIFELDDEK